MSSAGLCIGINYPGTSNSLFGCVNDAWMASKAAQYHLGINDIEMLTDDVSSDGQSKTSDCTKKQIEQALQRLVTKAKNGASIVFLHYSGHGTYTSDNGKEESDRRDEQILASDGAIRDDQLYNDFVAKLPATTTLIAVMDCCHSGTILDLPFLWKTDPVLQCTRENESVPLCRAIAVSGCKDRQYSADAYNRDEKRAEGAMSGALYRLLAKLTKSDILNDTIASLVVDLHTSLIDSGFHQKPQVSATHPISSTLTVSDWLKQPKQQSSVKIEKPKPQISSVKPLQSANYISNSYYFWNTTEKPTEYGDVSNPMWWSLPQNWGPLTSFSSTSWW